MTITSKYTLITNLDYVTVRDVRTHTHALLLVTDDHPLHRGDTPRRHLLRGFSTSPSVPTFDAILPTAEFTLEDTTSHDMLVMQGRGGAPVPLMHDAIMHIPEFGDVHLIADSQAGLDITSYPEGTQIERVWNDLERKVVEHWTAPNIMQPNWVPTSELRTFHSVRQRRDR